LSQHGTVYGMITLYTFGRRLGLPDPSPFVTKAEILLKMSGLPFRLDTTGFRKAPKGKLPYIEDGGQIIADSTFIRWYLETRHGIDFDNGLTERDKAIGWAFEKMCDDHLYWAVMESRWIENANFEKGPAKFFDFVPAPLRSLVRSSVRRQIRRDLKGHGFGRHTRADIEALAARDLDALSTFLGDKPYFHGEKPSGTDATVLAFVTGVLCPVFETPIRTHAEGKPNLVAYRDRLMARYYPELANKQ